ncbi:unnamed protein product [Dovyalis caffra]|uniref:Uncharacterized protein n=1 Tax=Dovyalis caffra TaxID=77055 RepID=A0AAV1SKN5_9ROSI|nr:unnamed protein product [Dovyalis caffra]
MVSPYPATITGSLDPKGTEQKQEKKNVSFSTRTGTNPLSALLFNGAVSDITSLILTRDPHLARVQPETPPV